MKKNSKLLCLLSILAKVIYFYDVLIVTTQFNKFDRFSKEKITFISIIEFQHHNEIENKNKSFPIDYNKKKRTNKNVLKMRKLHLMSISKQFI